MVVEAVEVNSFVLHQVVVVPPSNGRSRTVHPAITSFLTQDLDEVKALMAIYWEGGEDARIVEALPGGDVYSTPGIQVKTVAFLGPDGKDASKHLTSEHKAALGLS